MQMCQAWSFVDQTGWPSPATLDVNGYPISISNGGVSTVFQIPTQAQRSGDYYLITTGKGTLNGTGFSVTISSASNTNIQTLVSAASLSGQNTVSLHITATDTTTPITKVAFVHNQDVAAYLADNLAFGQAFISIMKQANAGVIRFLNWQNGNFSNETAWSTRKPQTYFTFADHEYPNQRADASLGCQVGYLGQTTSVLNDYSISDSVGTHAPVHGQIIILNFDATSVTCSSGANALIAWTGHGLVTGAPFYLFSTPANAGGAAPGGVTISGPTTFYAITTGTGTDANHIKFATSYANAIASTAITTTSTGAGLSAHVTVVISPATLTASGTNVAWPHHQTATGDPVMLSGACPATNISVGINYYSIVVDADNIKLATTKANAISNTAITFAGGGGVSMSRQPTLNLNSTGAVPIRNLNTSAVSAGNIDAPQARAYQDHIVYGSMVYDAGLNVWIKYGADQANTVCGFASNVPPEVCLKIVAAIGAHPYFVSPFAVLDPMTDYMPSLMQYLKTNAPAWMIPRFEVYNETWNTTPGTSYGQFKSWLNWNIQEGNPHNWVGKVGSTLGQAAAVVWPGGKGIAYQVLVGVQTATIDSPVAAAIFNDRLAASQYVAHGPTQAPLTGSWGTITFTKAPAYQWASHVCCVQYITPSLWGTTTGITPNESDMAHAWVVNGSLPNDPLLTQYVDTLAGPDSGFNLAHLNNNYRQISAWAQGAGVSGGWAGVYKLKMCGYEGGYSPSIFPAGGPNFSEIYPFRRASKMVADVGPCITGGTLANAATVTGTYNDFIAAGGEFPSCFQLSGTGDAWTVLDPDIYVTPQPTQWTAIVGYNYVAPQVGNFLRYRHS